MKGIIRVLCVVFIAILVSGCLVGCGNDGYKPESVVIYKEFNGVAGEDDALVKAELEKMFEEDTGKKIDLIIEYASSTGIQNKATTALADAGTRIDALVQATTSTAVCTSAIIDGLAMDITDLIDEKGTHGFQ